MRVTAALHALPPLPPRNTWSTAFPRPAYALVSLLNTRMTPNRVTLASSDMCDRFVQELKLKPDDVVLEAYSGPGVLTRSLLAAKPKKVIAVEPGPVLMTHPSGLGVDPEALAEVEAGVHNNMTPKKPGGAKTPKKKGRPTLEEQATKAAETAAPKRSKGRPSKVDEFDFEGLEGEEAAEEIEESMDDDMDSWMSASPRRKAKPSSSSKESTQAPVTEAAKLLESSHDESLAVLPLSPYDWDSWASLLLHPLFTGDKTIVKHREWASKTLPNLRFVAQIPDSMVGEQLISQWISCIPRRNWLFAYGRVRMDLLVSPSLFDRMIAQPDSKANCKLSITTRALCDVSLLPPYHMDFSQTTWIPNRVVRKDYRSTHDVNQPVENRHSRTPEQIAAKFKKDAEAKLLLENFNPASGYPFTIREATPTESIDFHPLRTSANSIPLERPALVGISVTPRKESVITLANKDCWDYVLRNLFVMNSKPLSTGIPILGPGANNLLKVIENPPSEWGVKAVDPSRLPRSFTLDDWTTVVMAFENWAFQPDNLTLVEATAADDQLARAIGGGM